MDNLLLALANLINLALTIYMWLIIIRALISWVNPDPYNRLVIFLYRATEPVLAPLRQFIPVRGLGIDLSPILAIGAIILLQSFLVPGLIELARSYR